MPIEARRKDAQGQGGRNECGALAQPHENEFAKLFRRRTVERKLGIALDPGRQVARRLASILPRRGREELPAGLQIVLR